VKLAPGLSGHLVGPALVFGIIKNVLMMKCPYDEILS